MEVAAPEGAGDESDESDESDVGGYLARTCKRPKLDESAESGGDEEEEAGEEANEETSAVDGMYESDESDVGGYRARACKRPKLDESAEREANKGTNRAKMQLSGELQERKTLTKHAPWTAGGRGSG